MIKRIGIIVGLLVAIVLLPVLLRKKSATASPDAADDRLVIITPHNESIRNEFGEAFARWWKQRSGRSVYVDWRTPGGTAEIRKVLDSGYAAAEERGAEGMGIDLFFGGGDYEFKTQHKPKKGKGRLVPLEVFDKHPEWFGEKGITQYFSGEQYYNDERTWVAACLSQFGICYNEDALKRLGLPVPQGWEDLGDPRYAGYLALADPSKSGSVARAFELLIQQQMQITTELDPVSENSKIARNAGWERGWQLIMRLCANARYFTDSASKIPQDVGQGDSVAGMCVDFYGRSFSDELKRADGSSRLRWIAPAGGSSLSGDPIAVMRGAPNPQVAQAFVEFVLEDAGQILWNAKPGTANGPVSKALRRMPVRRDIYSPQNQEHFSDGNMNPYEATGEFVYRPELTGKAFGTIRALVRIVGIDSHEEMKSAWKALREANFPPEAMKVFFDVSVLDYQTMKEGDPGLSSADALEAAARASELGAHFRAQYQRAEAMAREAIEKGGTP
jgi:ABC-type Fe3+ transport system substrate-binding protein